jgi:putative transposase
VEGELVEQVALHRWGVIAEAANPRLTPAQRGVLVRQIAARSHAHPDGGMRRYARGTIDRWLRAWRAEGLAGLRPCPRSDTGTVRAHPELFGEAAALRLELPTRSAAQIASILYHRHGIRVAERTVRAQLRRAGLHREALAAEPKVFGRYEAEHPNDRWITDVLVGPFVPYPKREGSVRARLFLIVDDHSRLLVDGEFFAHENARATQALLRRAIVRRGVPVVLYADNGAPFANAWLARTCALLGIRLVHSKPYSPQGRGKQERANRYIREAFLAEACHQGIDSIEELNDRFAAWTAQVANLRRHAETGQAPIERFTAAGPPRQADPARLVEAFRWSVTRKVTRTATVPLEGNSYAVDPALVARRVELRYDPEDLTRIEVFLDGAPAGLARPFITRRHVHRAVPQAIRPAPAATGVDYLGLVQAAHEDATGTGAPIDYAHLAHLTSDPDHSSDDSGENSGGGEGDDWQARR